MSFSPLSLALTDQARDDLNRPNQIDFRYNLIDIDETRSFSVGAFGAEASADLSVGLELDFFASLTLPSTELDFSLGLENAALVDEVRYLGEDITVQTSGFAFTEAVLESSLDLDTLGFSTGFDVNASAGISDIVLDPGVSAPLEFSGGLVTYDQSFELLGFDLGADANTHFSSDIDKIEAHLNSKVPVDALLSGSYGVPQLPIDFIWDFNNISFDAPQETHQLQQQDKADFSVLNGSGDGFANITLDLDDLLAQFALPAGKNPLLSPFEFNWSAEYFKDTWFESNFEILATLLDVDLEFGVELVQQTSFEQRHATVTAYDGDSQIASATLGDALSFAGLDAVGSKQFDLQYAVTGDVVTDWGLQFYFDIPVELLSFEMWRGELEFMVDDHGFTEPDIPDNAFGFTAYQNTFRVAQSAFVPIPGMTSRTEVELRTARQQIEVTFTDDEWVANASSDAGSPVQNPAALPQGRPKIEGTAGKDTLTGTSADDVICGLAGNDHLDGGAGDDTLDAGTGGDRLFGGTGDDLFLVGYGSDAEDYSDVVDGGAGTDRAVYSISGRTTLYEVDFVGTDGNRVEEFDTAFDLSRDLGNFSLIWLHEGDGARFANVEAIDIDASGAERWGSNGEFWYLGGTLYLGAGGTNTDRFIANWSDQTSAVEWDFAAQDTQTLANGVTVGGMERLHVAFGRGHDRVIGSTNHDHLDGGAGDDTLDGGTGSDSLFGGAGDDLLRVSYNADVGDYGDVVDGGAGFDRAHYALGGYATLYYVNFYQEDGTKLEDFDAIFDLSHDLSNFDLIELWGGSSTRFENVESIDIDASGAARWGSNGEFWYLGGTLYLGSGGTNTDRFIANWSDQTIAVEWDFSSDITQTLANGVTVGGMERLHVALGRGDDRVIGGAQNDYLHGGKGDDTLDGGIGSDVLHGGAGNDVFRVSHDSGANDYGDQVYGGLGTDRASYSLAGFATLYYVNFYAANGTRIEEFDTVFELSRDLGNFGTIELWGGTGTSFKNVESINIDASAAARRGSQGEFWYLGGTEYLGSGGTNVDRFIANWSDQTIAVEWDFATGSTLSLANGVTIGGMEHLHVAFGRGDDVVTAGQLHDYLDGGEGADRLDGGAGADTLIGGVGADTLYGGAGSDQLTGGAGNDQLGGGANFDSYYFEGNFGQDILVDADGGALHFSGHDSADIELSRDGSALILGFAGAEASVKILNYFGSPARWDFRFDDGSHILDASHLSDPWDVFNRAVTRSGDQGSQRWTLLESGEYVFAFGGDDVIRPGAGADLIDGGGGVDILFFHEAPMAVELDFATGTGHGGSAEGDRFRNVEGAVGSGAGDTINGSDQADYFHGAGGNDLLHGHAGEDRLFGGSGADRLHGGSDNDHIDGGDGNDMIYGNGQWDTIHGGAGEDTVIGGAGRDWVDLGAGDDLFQDEAQGGYFGRDTVEAGAGQDTVRGAGGNDSIHGAEGDDLLQGGAGNDTIRGGTGWDRIEAGGGNDRAIGGDGRDMVDLGGGDDLFIDSGQSGYFGQDTVEAGAGQDTVRGAGGNDSIHGAEGDDLLQGGAGNDTIRGGTGWDRIDAGGGNDRVIGGDGRDVVDLGAGDDLFIDSTQGGYFGRDTIDGGSGRDTIIARGGNDLLTGGADADIFVFRAGFDRDMITDFQAGLDQIDLRNLTDVTGFADMTIRAGVEGAELFATSAPQDVIILAGIDVALIDGSDILFV